MGKARERSKFHVNPVFSNAGKIFVARFSVPGQPRPKERPRVRANPQKGQSAGVTPPKTKRYEELVGWIARSCVSPDAMLSSGLYVVDVVAFFRASDARVRKMAEAYPIPYDGPIDLDNVLKALLDGMEGIVYPNDRQVVGQSIEGVWGADPGVLVNVHRLDLMTAKTDPKNEREWRHARRFKSFEHYASAKETFLRLTEANTVARTIKAAGIS